MTFLQPFILWGLPLVLVPVLIHLLNRMRHRPQPWAAMRFLVSATRSSISNARLRQWLILLLRVLAVLMLVLFLSRPLAGGWLGWALSPAPDAILILLDRSASMETRVPGSERTRREQALQALTDAARPFEESSHLVLIDSATRAPQEIGRAANLSNSPLSTPTDTAADIPGLIGTALNWLLENRAGTAELWLASDLQRSNWQPEDARWQSLVAQLHALPQRIRVRLLALDQGVDGNRSVSVKEINRRSRANLTELQFALDIQASTAKAETIPLTITLDGARTEQELKLEGQFFRWRHRLSLDKQAGSGWGSVALPADANGRDNVAYFVYGAETPLRASVISADSRNARLLQLALGAGHKNGAATAEIIQPSSLSRAVWEDNTLLVWQESPPTGAIAQRIRAFVQEGGTVLFLPPGNPDSQRFEGLSWSEVQSAGTDRSFRVLRWNEDEGPLAKSDEGLSLPLPQTPFQKRQAIVGQKTILAAFQDGAPFLARQTLGRGEIFFCASLPDREWSSLGEGPVLVPMMQRLLQSGSRRLQQATAMACGELSVLDQARHWERVDGGGPNDVRTQAGVYRSGDRLLAVNRPVAEDSPDVLEATEARTLFGALPLQMLQEKRSQATDLQGEIWRVFLVTMLLFLVAEGALILPPKPAWLGEPGGIPAAARARTGEGVEA
jgi:hypothetical protein